MKRLTKTILPIEEEVSEPIVMLENESITFSGYHQYFKELFENGEKKREKKLQPNFYIIKVDQTNVL